MKQFKRSDKAMRDNEVVTIYREYLNYHEVITKDGEIKRCNSFELKTIEDDKGTTAGIRIDRSVFK